MIMRRSNPMTFQPVMTSGSIRRTARANALRSSSSLLNARIHCSLGISFPNNKTSRVDRAFQGSSHTSAMAVIPLCRHSVSMSIERTRNWGSQLPPRKRQLRKREETFKPCDVGVTGSPSIETTPWTPYSVNRVYGQRLSAS